jgi:hypothetical protein
MAVWCFTASSVCCSCEYRTRLMQHCVTSHRLSEFHVSQQMPFVLQLRSAYFTVRLYSPASTAAVAVQLSYYHRVLLSCSAGSRMLATQTCEMHVCKRRRYVVTKETMFIKALVCCQMRWMSVEYRTVLRFALVDAATDAFARDDEVRQLP